MYPFSFLIFFLRVWLKVYQFFYLFIEQALHFIDLFYCFHLCFIISTLIFRISFLLLSLGFVCSSFSSCFGHKVRLFLRDFVSWGKIVCVCLCSVVSNSLGPHWLWPTRLLCPWDFPSKNTRVEMNTFPTSRNLTNPGTEPMSPTLVGRFFTPAPDWKPKIRLYCYKLPS